MANLLYRLGRFSYRRRGKLVTSFWALLLALLAIGAIGFSGRTVDSFSIPGTESQRALDALHTSFPAAAGVTGTIVVQTTDGQPLTSPAVAQQVKAIAAKAAQLPGAIGAVDPYTSRAISADGSTGLISVMYPVPGEALSDEQKAAYDDFGDQTATQALRVVPGGNVTNAPPEIGVTEVVGVAVAAVVLIITFGSLMAAGMTLLTALIGVIAGMAGLFALTSVIDVSSTAPILALMLGLAVGIDYALFISSRHRTQLGEGMAAEESVARATATAGSAVLFAGATVVIALAGLSLVGVPFLTAMGLAAAGTVLTAVLVALTLLPALLGFIGRRILPRKLRAANTENKAELVRADESAFGFRWGRFVTRFRIPIVALGVIVLAVLSIPAADLRLALPGGGTAPKHTNQRVAYDLIAEAFGPGFNGPLIMVVSGGDAAATQALAGRAAAAVQGVKDVVAVAPGAVNQTGTTQLLTVIPASGPTTQETADLVGNLRTATRPLATGGDTVAVTGFTAVGVDVSAKLSAALPRYLAVVIGLSFLLLMLAFRSVLVPLKAAAGFVLTIGATFGITTAIFQWGWAASLFGIDTPGPMVSFLPILILGVIFGLAMDYEVFIASRVREEFVHGKHANEATIAGLGHGARVVTAAALIMSAVFAGFILVDDPTIKTIGFGLTIGVLIDAFIVRMTLVPAVLSLLGDRAWYFPRWLDKITPRVDIEGESLRPVHAEVAAVEEREVVGVR